MRRGDQKDPAEAAVEPLYPANRSFVVQLAGLRGSDAGTVGRIEHIPSGRSRVIERGDDLLIILRQILDEAATPEGEG